MNKLENFQSPRLLVAVSIATLVVTQILSSVHLDFSSMKLDATVVPSAFRNNNRNNKRKLIQVMNAYSVPGPDNTRVSPFDQWITIQSIQRAKRYAPKDLEIDFVCAMFPTDLEALPHLPCRKVLLQRSTKTEYPFFEETKELPFIQDILDSAMQDELQRGNDDFFVMLTNSDISLTKDFYPFVYDNMQTKDAFSINRLTIPMKLLNKTTNAEHLLAQVDEVLTEGNIHPGFDCFIVHSSVLKRLKMGDLFAGHPPWGSLLFLSLRIMAYNYSAFPSNVSKTFHLGNDRSKWSNANNQTYSEIERNRWFLEACPAPAFGDHPYTILNTINCGRWFEYHRFYNNHTIPNFVQPGYEQMYLDRYRNTIRYSGPQGRGKPERRGSSTNNKAAQERRRALQTANMTVISTHDMLQAATTNSATTRSSSTLAIEECFKEITSNSTLAKRLKRKVDFDEQLKKRKEAKAVEKL